MRRISTTVVPYSVTRTEELARIDSQVLYGELRYRARIPNERGDIIDLAYTVRYSRGRSTDMDRLESSAESRALYEFRNAIRQHHVHITPEFRRTDVSY